MSVQATTETITPVRAAELLEGNTSNRPVKKNLVGRLAAAMLEGRYQFNGETIKVAKGGRLIDGQHRLLACVESKRPFKTLIVYGLQPEVFNSVDIGNIRSGADILGCAGEQYAHVLAAGVGHVYAWERGDIAMRIGVPKDALQGVLERHPRLRQLCIEASYLGAAVGYPGLTLAFRYIFGAQNEPKAEAFFLALKEGAELGKTSPVLHLRNFLLTQKNSRSKKSKLDVMAYYIKAWNAYVTGRQLTFLKWNPSIEEFPEIAQQARAAA